MFCFGKSQAESKTCSNFTNYTLKSGVSDLKGNGFSSKLKLAWKHFDPWASFTLIGFLLETPYCQGGLILYQM